MEMTPRTYLAAAFFLYARCNNPQQAEQRSRTCYRQGTSGVEIAREGSNGSLLVSNLYAFPYLF